MGILIIVALAAWTICWWYNFFFASSEREKRLHRGLKEASETHDRWLEKHEEDNRNDQSKKDRYPRDWTRRRVEVFRRASGKCESCGVNTGQEQYDSDPRFALGLKVVGGAQIHHIIPITKGGDHSLSNLKLLCETCHIDHRPDLDPELFEKDFRAPERQYDEELWEGRFWVVDQFQRRAEENAKEKYIAWWTGSGDSQLLWLAQYDQHERSQWNMRIGESIV